MLPTSIQVWRRHPAFPAQWLYGLYEIVLVTLLFVTPSPCEALASSRVDACIGASDPIDFAVRNSALVFRTIASTASHRTFVTIASAPLIAGDGRCYAVDLGSALSGIFFISGLDAISEHQK